MRISRLRVHNHSRIADLELEIRRHAVIVGANDVGKTSLLRLMNFLLGSTTAAMYQGLTPEDLRDPTSPLHVAVTLIDFDDTDRAMFASEISIAPGDGSESLRVELTVTTDPDDPGTVEIRRWFPEAGHARTPTRDQLQRFAWRYLPATRGASAAAMDGPNSALRALLQAIEMGAERDDLVVLLDGFNKKLADSKSLALLRDNAAAHLSRAMPRSIERDDLAVRTATEPEEDVLQNVSMFFKRGDVHVPLTDQSDGVRQLVSMTLFDLAEGAANVVAIDEPELHLHPASQRTVAELFGAASNQKILVTHSPFVVQRFEPGHVISVDRDGHCHQIPDGKLNAVEKQRVNWWSPRLLEVLTARYVIVVEGLTDRVIVERSAELLNIHLDRLGAVVFDIDGADKFKHVYRLIGKDGFKVPLLGLVDEKEKGSWLGAIGGRPKDVFGHAVWVSDPDLEAEVCGAFGGPAAAQALIDGGFCGESAVLQACDVTALGDVTVDAVAKYCRSGKVAASIALASQLSAETVAKISSVHGLLSELERLSNAS